MAKRKSLKSLPRELKGFAAELSAHNIRYRIGKQALVIPYYDGTMIQHAYEVKSHLEEYTLYVTFEGPPYNVHPMNKVKYYRIWAPCNSGHYFEAWWTAYNHLVEILKSCGAWQKNGIDTRGE